MSMGLCTEVEGLGRRADKSSGACPPVVAPSLWSTVAQRDELVGTMSLPYSPSGDAIKTVPHLPERAHWARGGWGGGRPTAKRVAYQLMFQNTGLLGYCHAMGAAMGPPVPLEGGGGGSKLGRAGGRGGCTPGPCPTLP